MEPDVEAAVTALAAADELPSAPAAPTATIALREPQVQNAVAFLSHPKVRGSSLASKRSFLEGKGLTAAEIDEGFRRTPDAPTSTERPATTPSVPPKPFPVATSDALQSLTPVQHTALQTGPPQPEPIRWTQVVAGAGALAAGVWVVHHFILPPALRWWRGGVAEPGADERAASAVATAIQAQTVEMRATLEGMKSMLAELKEQKAASGGVVGLADLRRELHSLARSLDPGARGSDASESKSLRREIEELKAMAAATAASKQQNGGMSSDDLPSFARTEPPLSNGHTHANGHAHDSSARSVQSDTSASPAQPSHPASYMEVLEMLERGETPPGIRSDIVDTPPDPLQPTPEARLKPRAKPWERNQQPAQSRPRSDVGASPSRAGSSVDGEVKGVKITEIEPGAPSETEHNEPWRPPSAPQRSIFSQSPAASTSGD